MSKIFELHNVSVRRNGNTIVSGVNWQVNAGENWVLLGANGIGKSTLINLISTHMFPTSGSVDLLGHRLGEVDVFSLRSKIGILSADYGNSFPNSEIPLNIVALAFSGMTGTWGDARDERYLTKDVIAHAEDMLALFGVISVKNRAWGLLSQGERKRVMMARTLMSDPELLLFDEPTAGLDLCGREQVINTLNKLASEGREHSKKRAIILVNHNVEEIPPSFDNIAIMCRDKVNGAGTFGAQGKIKDTLTSENLTNAYGIDLQVQRTANLRYFASASVILEANEI